ncbi:MAG TPA: DUF4214 domain-containing protein [Iamia sp.]|nr:DUF4214 domain-containing protein [Iamia sp.]
MTRRVQALVMAAAVVVSAAAGVLAAGVAVAPAAGASPVLAPTVDPASKASVTAAYRTSLGAARAVPTGWTGSTATCTKGVESPASIDATAAAVNFYRAMNGLAPITMDPALHSKALAAALMMEATVLPSHTPGPDWPCYTAEGADGAARGNLSRYAAARAIDDYVQDAGDTNEFAGHRRQVLSPRFTTFGTGSTSHRNSLIYGAVGTRPAGVDWVSWPSEGFVPKTLFPSRFSLANNLLPDADYSAATISVKVGATSLAVTKHSQVFGYGDNTLTWDVALPSGFLTTARDVRFDITVAGIRTAGGQAVPAHSYSSTAYVGEAPAPPATVSATINAPFAEVTWPEPGYDGGGVITGYTITPYVNGVAQPSEDFGNGRTQYMGPLVNGASYTFKVRSRSLAGTGGQSVASNAITATGAATKPAVPTAITAVAGNGRATVSWTAPAANGGSAISSYEVTPYIDGVEQPPVTSAGTGTSKVVTGLTNGTAHTFRVRAFNGVDHSDSSDASGAVTPTAGATVPAAPTGASATAGNAQASVSWTAPGSNGGSAITGYVVTPYVGATAQTPVSSAGTGTSKVVTGLTNGTAYTFKVAAVNALGTGTRSGASGAVTPTAAIAPYAPFASWSAFVTRQYVDLTARAPSSASLSSWVAQLTAGTKAKGDLDHALRRGSENLANVDPVVRLYRAFLGRAPDAGGLEFWIARKRNVAPARTWSLTQIATGFTSSIEFKTKYGSMSNRAFVTQIYTDVLLRPADAAGVDYWTGTLDRGRKTRAQVVVGFSESVEYKTKQAQNTDVAVAYISLMGRAPTTAEASNWVTRQKAGTPDAALLTELLTSAEYATHITG